MGGGGEERLFVSGQRKDQKMWTHGKMHAVDQKEAMSMHVSG